MTRMLLGLVVGLAAAGAQGQTVPPTATPTPDVQTGRSASQPPPAPASSDLRGVTPADSGSAIDKPAPVEAMPRTGYHAPVIPDPAHAERPAHARLREIRPAVSPTEGAAQNADALRPVDQRQHPAENGR